MANNNYEREKEEALHFESLNQGERFAHNCYYGPRAPCGCPAEVIALGGDCAHSLAGELDEEYTFRDTE